ncbi:MAG: guanylate kinase [Filifactoraceae bacterium]
MKRQGLLVVVSGPSGAGKGTICKKFLNKHPEVKISVSATTRNPRAGEIDGESYHFISKEEFGALISEDGLLEYVHVFGNYYGTPKDFVFKNMEHGSNVILEIEIEGAKSVKEKYPDAILVFILPPTLRELHTRITKRGTEDEGQISLRLARALEEIRTMEEYSYFIINEDIDSAVKELEGIMIAEKNSVKRYFRELLEKYEEE